MTALLVLVYCRNCANADNYIPTACVLYRSPSVHTQSPDDIPPIDPRVVCDLEIHARKVADSLDNMMQTLTNKLYKVKQPFCFVAWMSFSSSPLPRVMSL